MHKTVHAVPIPCEETDRCSNVIPPNLQHGLQQQQTDGTDRHSAARAKPHNSSKLVSLPGLKDIIIFSS